MPDPPKIKTRMLDLQPVHPEPETRLRDDPPAYSAQNVGRNSLAPFGPSKIVLPRRGGIAATPLQPILCLRLGRKSSPLPNHEPPLRRFPPTQRESAFHTRDKTAVLRELLRQKMDPSLMSQAGHRQG